MQTQKMTGLLSFLVLVCSVACSQPANTWTASRSGYWEEPLWSLGILPAADQSVMITNQGWKAVGIRNATCRDFPQTMTVSNLTVSAPSNSWSTLLLNWSDALPLTVSNEFELGPRARLGNMHSSLAATYLSSKQAEIICNTASLKAISLSLDASTGELIDSQVQCSSLSLGGNTNSSITQVRGFTRVTSALSVGGGYVHEGPPSAGGSFLLTNGILEAGSIQIGARSSARFVQHQSSVTGPVSVGGTGDYESSYVQVGGTLIGGVGVSGSCSQATFSQYGGSNHLVAIAVGGGSGIGGCCFYFVSGGVLETGGISVGPSLAGCSFWQNGSTVTVSGPIKVFGGGCYSQNFCYGSSFDVCGGRLIADSLYVANRGYYSQIDAAVKIVGDVYVEGFSSRDGYYQVVSLIGGSLSCANLEINDTDATISADVAVQGTLRFSGPYAPSFPPWPYTHMMFSGRLSASSIEIFAHVAFNPRADGTAPKLSGSVTLGGWITLEDLDVQLDSLGTADTYFSPGIQFNSPNGVLRFAPSAARTWHRLEIRRWAGSLQGGAGTQLYFGTNETGLSESQLRRINFVDPAGLPAGSYVGRILSTGEVVPERRPLLGSSRESGKLVLTWSQGCVLQQAPLPAGPYSDLVGAIPPLITNLSDPRGFFRLRRLTVPSEAGIGR